MSAEAIRANAMLQKYADLILTALQMKVILSTAAVFAAGMVLNVPAKALVVMACATESRRAELVSSIAGHAVISSFTNICPTLTLFSNNHLCGTMCPRSLCGRALPVQRKLFWPSL